ncbi:BrnT family toxin [Thiorhodococcus minor]|uniref:BrnT family toxin n=1 Tax=Thiorhodococcus minor TaxID=57489 RepID=A0A6M0K547_9GAMM|nr:BrnT family toxin [Thiorhodococcus minor]
MDITFDPAKDARNRAKHGVSLALAADIEWDTALSWTDTRQDYGEDRQCGIGYIGLRLFYVVYVDQAEGLRIISLRKATKSEIDRYATS